MKSLCIAGSYHLFTRRYLKIAGSYHFFPTKKPENSWFPIIFFPTKIPEKEEEVAQRGGTGHLYPALLAWSAHRAADHPHGAGGGEDPA